LTLHPCDGWHKNYNYNGGKIMERIKSCLNCKNHNTCKYRKRIFDDFELASFIMGDISSFIKLILENIACRCKYYELDK
jgi:hypothetical protein